MRRLLLLLLVLPTLALAQSPAPDAGRRVERVHACVVDVHARIARYKLLFEDARRQLQRAPEGSDTHRDAEKSLAVVEGRLREAARDLVECLPPEPSARAERKVEVVQTGEGGSVVRESGPRTLAANVSIVKGERIDGHGRHSPGTIRDSVVALASELSRCHDELAGRRAFESGKLSLVFTVDERGETRGVAVENARLGDEPFRACVRDVGARLRAPAARGGSAQYAFELAFGDAS